MIFERATAHETTTDHIHTAARNGALHLGHGVVTTPAFMPVGTNASVKAIWPDDLVDLGFQCILGNTYHLSLRPGSGRIREAGGLHRFMAWKRNILTDSGGFQVFSLADRRVIDDDGVTFASHVDGARVRFTPESVVEAQRDFGSDIMMPLDVCPAADADRDEVARAVELTSAWAVRALDRWRSLGSGELFAIVQGGLFAELRRASATTLVDLDAPGYAIGGLSVGESFGQFVDILSVTAELLPTEKPRYVMGIGTPDLVIEAIAAGIDLFDCVFPTRVARNARAMTTDGSVNLKASTCDVDDPLDSDCDCRVCRNYSRAYLRHLCKAREIMASVLLTYHNLAFMARLISGAREAIDTDVFDAYRREVVGRWREGNRRV